MTNDAPPTLFADLIYYTRRSRGYWSEDKRGFRNEASYKVGRELERKGFPFLSKKVRIEYDQIHNHIVIGLSHMEAFTLGPEDPIMKGNHIEYIADYLVENLNPALLTLFEESESSGEHAYEHYEEEVKRNEDLLKEMRVIKKFIFQEEYTCLKTFEDLLEKMEEMFYDPLR